MKSVARWWPGLDKAIEEVVKSCTSCHSPAVQLLTTSSIGHGQISPGREYILTLLLPSKVQCSLLLLMLILSGKKCFVMKKTTATKTIELLHVIFARFGLPEQVVTDNGPQFVSEDFSHFLKSNGIKHIRCAPYHPASNGLEEQFVQSLKMALKSTVSSGLSLQHCLSNFLFKLL